MNSAPMPAKSSLSRYAMLLLVLLSTYHAVAQSTTTTVASSQTPITLGDTVTFTATVTPTGTGTPTGLVTFFDGATPLGSGTLNGVAGNDQATFATSLMSASGSPHSITATYQGDSNFTSSTSTAISQTVNPRTSTTGVAMSPTSVVVGQASTATVTVTDSGSVPPGTPDTFSPTGAPATGRTGFTATMFGNGLVLVAGGTGADGATILNSAEIYSVSGGSFGITGNLNTARTGAVAVLLPTGKILVAGGSSNGTSNGALNTAELFNPVTGTFSVAGSGSGNAMAAARFGATATLLNNGQVLLAGGGNSGGVLNSAELYNPATDTFTATSNLNTARTGATATLLATGKVLIAGGSSDGTANGALTSAELFDPTAGTFTAISSALSAARWQPAAALLLSGKVLIAGGLNSTGPLFSADIYDPVANTFTASNQSMSQTRVNGSAVAMPNGMVLLAGGVSETPVDLYDPESDRFDATGSLVNSDNGLVGTLLNNGDVLVVGLTAVPGLAPDAELYSPSFNPLGTVTVTSSEPTDIVTGSCMLSPSNSTASTCTSTVTAGNVAAGTHTITGTYPADAIHSGSSNTASLTVTPAATSTAVASSLNPSVSGQSVTFTATVSDSSTGSTAVPTGTVQFVVDGSNFGSPVALTPASSNSSVAVSQSTSTLTVGTHSVTANYSNTDGNFTGSSGTLSGGQIVNQTFVAPPAIAKAFSPIGMQPNGTSTLTITITNPSTSTAALQGVAFTDNFPANVVVANPNNLTNSCGGTATATAGSSSVSLTGGTIAVNSSCAVTATVTSASTGSYLNTTGAVTSTNGGTGNSASATLGVAFPPTISKLFSPSTIPQNQTTLLSFTINNPNSNSTPPNTDVTLTGISFTDNLPSGLVIANPNNLSNNCDGTVTANPGSSTITLTGGDLGPAVGLISIHPHHPLLSQTQTSLKPLQSKVQSKASRLPQSAGVVRGGPQQLLQPSASGSCFISVEVQPNTSGTFNNTTGTISANESGTGATSNTATLTVGPAVQPPTVAKAFGAGSVPLNGTTSLTLTFSNPNSSTNFTNVSADDPLPSGLVVASPNGLSGTCLADGATVFANPGGNDINTVGTSLSGNTSCTVVVNVTGTIAGTQNNTTGNVSATFQSGDTDVSISGGSASASLIVVAPPVIAKAFNPNSIALSEPTSLGFTITNPTVNPVALTGVGFSDVLPSGLTVANGTSTVCSGTLTISGGNTISLSGATVPANGSCTFNVTVTATAFGSYTNTTGNVTSTNGGTGNIATASLTVFPVVITPTSVNFGDVDSQQVVAATVNIANNGSTAVPISISLTPGTGANANNFAFVTNCPSSLPASQSCTVVVAFAAPNVTNASQLGVSTATLNVTSASNFTQQVPLQANVIDPEPQFTPNSLSFGSHGINTSTTLTTQLKNVGLTALNIQSITIGGANPQDFSFQSSCPASLSPGSACNINVTFTPLVKGKLAATLILTSNDGTTNVPLSGQGTGGGAITSPPMAIDADAPILEVSPGGTASMGFNVTSTSGEGTLMVTWSGALPPGVTVSLNPASIDTSQLSARVTLTAVASASASLAPQGRGGTPPLYAALFPVLGIVGLALGRKRGKVVRLRLALLFAGLMILFVMMGCGGMATPPSSSSAGSFPLEVTVTSTTTGHSASTSVTLQMMK